MQSAKLRLTADIGGARTRFALARPGGDPEWIRVVATAATDSLVGAVRHHLDNISEISERPKPIEGVFAVAGPVTGDQDCAGGSSRLKSSPVEIEISATFHRKAATKCP
jgi:glucokinase